MSVKVIFIDRMDYSLNLLSKQFSAQDLNLRTQSVGRKGFSFLMLILPVSSSASLHALLF